MSDTLASRRIYTQVAGRLSQMIAEGRFAPGSYLPPERELAQRFGVSRSSIREGIIALEVRGLVDVRVGAGVLVRSADAEDRLLAARTSAAIDPELGLDLDPFVEIPPFAILQARRLIEPECAALAARLATPAQLDLIAAAFARNVEDNDAGSRTHPGDRLFHIRIAEASGNAAYLAILIQLLGHGYGPVFRRLQALYTPDDMPRRSEDEHRRILDALLVRKAEGARMAMRNHLDNVIEIFSR